MSQTPVVSIVVPSFGQAEYLEETLRSVFAQEYSPIEVIAVDGGSTDGSVDILRRYENRLAWWVSESDRGQTDALNKGFARASGDILGWVCSDDTLLPGTVSAGVAALAADPDALLVYGDAELVDGAGQSLGLLPARPFDLVEMVRTCQNHVVQPGSLFTRRAWELAGPLTVESHYYFDFELVLRIALHGRAAHLDRALGTYRLHPESKSSAGTLIKATDHERLYAALFARTDLPPELRAVEAEARSRSSLTAGEYYDASGRRGTARRAYMEGLRRHPRHLDARVAGLVARTFLPARVRDAGRAFRAARVQGSR